jgi:hypothetical protein
MSEWIKHDGGPCPVAGDVVVDVKFRSGEVVEKSAAYGWDWGGGSIGDCIITHYRLSKPETPAAPEPDLRAKFDRFDKATLAHGIVLLANSPAEAEYKAAKADLLAAVGLA